jgi:hypothetical protein
MAGLTGRGQTIRTPRPVCVRASHAFNQESGQFPRKDIFVAEMCADALARRFAHALPQLRVAVEFIERVAGRRAADDESILGEPDVAIRLAQVFAGVFLRV